jgi:uncharacterized membrane protein
MLHVVLLALHLLAATFWVGGMAAMYFAARTAAAAVLPPPQRLAFMSAALTRFFRGVQAALAVIFASGIAMYFLLGGFAGVHWRIYAMFGVAFVMAGLFDHARKRPLAALQRAVAASDWPAAGGRLNEIRRLVALNLGLGVAVYAIAIVGRAVS